MNASPCSPPPTPTCSPRAPRAPTTSGPTRPGPSHESMAATLEGCRPRRRPDPRLAAGPVQRASSGSARPACRWSCSAASRRPNAELMELSTVPIGVAARGAPLPGRGRAGQPRPAARLPLRHRAADRRGLRAAGRAAGLGRAGPRPARAGSTSRCRPRVGILFYRAHHAAGNTAFVARAGRRDRRGRRRSACRSSARRCATHPPTCSTHLGTLDALIVTVLAAGGTKPATASAGGDDEAWDVSALAALDIPILQGLCLTCEPRATWAASDEGVTPLDVGHPGRGPGVRRPDHHRAVLLQGDRRRRAAALRRRPRALRAGSPGSRSTTPGCGTSRRASARSRSCCRPTRPSTPGSATPSAWTPRSRRSGCCARCATQGYDLGEPGEIPARPLEPSRARPDTDGRQRADPRADRRRWPGRGVADQRAAHRAAGADPGGRLPRWTGRRCRPS